MKELNLFTEIEQPKVKRYNGGSRNPIVFHDYESFVAKFKDNPKTTDDTFTPKDVYEAVLKYVGSVIDLNSKQILRPFYPGGDYKNADYPENGIVIDNPPFSMFLEICRFYTTRDIPFFLFGQGKTIFGCIKYCTAVIVTDSITYENGAKIYTNFASNIFGDTAVMTAPELNGLISSCPSQQTKSNLTSYIYPAEVLSFSQMQTICRGGYNFSVGRKECKLIKDLDNHPKSLFGNQLLLSFQKAFEKENLRMNAQHTEKGYKESIKIELSERENRIIKLLST